LPLRGFSLGPKGESGVGGRADGRPQANGKLGTRNFYASSGNWQLQWELSVCPFLFQHRPKGSPDHNDIQPDAPVMYVPGVHSDSFGIVYITPSAALPHAGNSGEDGIIFADIDVVFLYFLLYNRPWSHEAHFAFEDVHELGEFVQACFSEEFSALCDTGVVFQFEFAVPFFFCRGVGSQEVFQDFLGVGYHGPEFIAVKFFSVFPYAAVFEDDRSRGVVVDPEGDGEENGRNADTAHYGQNYVEYALECLIDRSGQVIFDAEHHDFFIKEGGCFHIAHGDSHEIRDDGYVFSYRLGPVDEGGEIVLGEAGGCDEDVPYSCISYNFFQIFESAEDGEVFHIG